MDEFDPRSPDYAARVTDSFHRQGFMRYIGAELANVTPGFCEIRLPYREELCQQHGFFHGGVIAAIADNAAGYAAFSLMEADSSVLTVEFKLNLLCPGAGEEMVARGEVVRAGKALTVCRSDVFGVKGDEEKHCATALVTLMTLPGRADEATAT